MLPDPEIEIDSLFRFSDISLFHEQNHRIIWSLLPPPPTEESDMRRYLNFAESLVVTLTDDCFGNLVSYNQDTVRKRRFASLPRNNF